MPFNEVETNLPKACLMFHKARRMNHLIKPKSKLAGFSHLPQQIKTCGNPSDMNHAQNP
jgi:hypothetical protein